MGRFSNDNNVYSMVWWGVIKSVWGTQKGDLFGAQQQLQTMVCGEESAALDSGRFRRQGERLAEKDEYGDAGTMVLWAVRWLVEAAQGLDDGDKDMLKHLEARRWIMECEGFKPGMGDNNEERAWRHALEQEVFQAELALLIVAEMGADNEERKAGEFCCASWDARRRLMRVFSSCRSLAETSCRARRSSTERRKGTPIWRKRCVSLSTL